MTEYKCAKCNKPFEVNEEVYRVTHHIALVKMKKAEQGLWPSAQNTITLDQQMLCKECYENNA